MQNIFLFPHYLPYGITIKLAIPHQHWICQRKIIGNMCLSISPKSPWLLSAVSHFGSFVQTPTLQIHGIQMAQLVSYGPLYTPASIKLGSQDTKLNMKTMKSMANGRLSFCGLMLNILWQQKVQNYSVKCSENIFHAIQQIFNYFIIFQEYHHRIYAIILQL